MTFKAIVLLIVLFILGFVSLKHGLNIETYEEKMIKTTHPPLPKKYPKWFGIVIGFICWFFVFYFVVKFLTD